MPVVEVNGTTINYRFDGSDQGPVVMLSNSLASDLSMWEFQVPALADAGYRILRYDSRGHGQSAVPEGPYSIDMLTADAVGLMDSLGLKKVHFCGISLGGMVGQKLGTQYGNRLISLVLCSTSAHIAPKDIWDERMETVRNGGMEAVVDATLDRWFTQDGQKRLHAAVVKIRQMILNTSIDGFCACCAAIRDMDQRESIRAISTRALVVVGENDIGTPVSSAELIHARIPFSALRVFSNAAHFLHVEQASAFNHALLDFLKKSAA